MDLNNNNNKSQIRKSGGDSETGNKDITKKGGKIMSKVKFYGE